MAATGFTPISLYYSTTAATAPSAGNLVAGELALNTLDEKLYFKNSAGTVKLLANSASSGTVTSVAATVPSIFSISGSPITSSGTLAMTYSGTALPIANGGTNATTASITSFNNITGYTAAGATGTTSTSLVFSTSPTLTTPTISGYVESVAALGTVTGTATIVITAGTVVTATLTASTPCTFTMPTSPTAGNSFILRLTQAATGMTTATFTGVKWPGGTVPTITATASAVDIISFVYIGTAWYGNAAQAFA